MSFDSTKPYKNVDGVNINLTPFEINQLTVDRAVWAADVIANPPIPDLATQLASALLTNGIIKFSDLNSNTLTQVNTTLQKAGLGVA